MNASPLTVRRARREDAPVIADLFLASRRHSLAYLPEIHSDEETHDWIANWVMPNEEVWVAEREGKILGFASLEGPHLSNLYIAPDAQRQGVGKALFEKVTERRPKGFEFWVFQRNAQARAFYEAQGCLPQYETDGGDNEEKEPDVRYAWTAPSTEVRKLKGS